MIVGDWKIEHGWRAGPAGQKRRILFIHLGAGPNGTPLLVRSWPRWWGR